jgi:hypothetical protein
MRCQSRFFTFKTSTPTSRPICWHRRKTKLNKNAWFCYRHFVKITLRGEFAVILAVCPPDSSRSWRKHGSDPEQNVGRSRLPAKDIVFLENTQGTELQIITYEQQASRIHCEMQDVIMTDRRLIWQISVTRQKTFNNISRNTLSESINFSHFTTRKVMGYDKYWQRTTEMFSVLSSTPHWLEMQLSG